MIGRVPSVPGVPTPLGPYSQAVIANGFVFTAGQVPLDAHGTEPAEFAAQVAQTIENLKRVLETAGSSLDRVVKVNGYLTSHDQLADYNRVYEEYFRHVGPARTTVCVSLWGVSMELECVAVVGDPE